MDGDLDATTTADVLPVTALEGVETTPRLNKSLTSPGTTTIPPNSSSEAVGGLASMIGNAPSVAASAVALSALSDSPKFAVDGEDGTTERAIDKTSAV